MDRVKKTLRFVVIVALAMPVVVGAQITASSSPGGSTEIGARIR